MTKRKLSARETALLVVLVIGSIALWLGLRSGPGNFGFADRTAGAGYEQLGNPPIVRIELLALKTAGFEPPGRDLFSYYSPRKRSQPVETSQSPRQIRRPSQPPSPIEPSSPVSSVEPTPPKPGFNYIGCLGQKDDLIAVFNGGTEILVAQIGDLVDERFRLLEFRYEAVVLEYVADEYKGEIVRLGR